jgi:hypothetical protein
MEITVEELEDNIGGFLEGVLPTLVDVEEKAFGWKVHFVGSTDQRGSLQPGDPRKNKCWVSLGNTRVTYRFPTEDDGTVKEETEFTYGITLEAMKPNVGLQRQNPAMTYALKLVAHRDGYNLFNVCGISSFEIVSQHVKAMNENSVFYVELILRLRAVIVLSKIASANVANSAKVTLYDREKEEYCF